MSHKSTLSQKTGPNSINTYSHKSIIITPTGNFIDMVLRKQLSVLHYGLLLQRVARKMSYIVNKRQKSEYWVFLSDTTSTIRTGSLSDLVVRKSSDNSSSIKNRRSYPKKIEFYKSYSSFNVDLLPNVMNSDFQFLCRKRCSYLKTLFKTSIKSRKLK